MDNIRPWLDSAEFGRNVLLHEALGLRIVEASLDEGLKLTCANGWVITLNDEGQSCCESRYITCDDDVGSLVGGVFYGVRKCVTGREWEDDEDDDDEVHDVVFIDVVTSVGSITLCTHNEHNGYYGGFSVTIRIRNPEGDTYAGVMPDY